MKNLEENRRQRAIAILLEPAASASKSKTNAKKSAESTASSENDSSLVETKEEVTSIKPSQLPLMSQV